MIPFGQFKTGSSKLHPHNKCGICGEPHFSKRKARSGWKKEVEEEMSELTEQDIKKMKMDEIVRAIRSALEVATKEKNTEGDDLWKALDNETKLLLTSYIFRKLRDHLFEGGTYRYLIYDRLGFGMDAYSILYLAGGMDISNALFTAKEQYKQTENEG